jgi:hypothetical protein
MAFYDMSPMGYGGMNVGGMSVGGMPVGGALTAEERKRYALQAQLTRAQRLIDMSRKFPQATAQELVAGYRQEYPAKVKGVKMSPQEKQANALRRAQAIVAGTYQPEERKAPKGFALAKKGLMSRMKVGKKSSIDQHKFGDADLVAIANALSQLGFGIHDLETGSALDLEGMGFFDDLWSGVKDVGKTALQVAPHLLPFIM